jgi:hypothetical protein
MEETKVAPPIEQKATIVETKKKVDWTVICYFVISVDC